SIESGANSAQTLKQSFERSVDAPEKVADIDADIVERLVALNKVDREQAKVLREELATLEGKIRQRENAIEALQGRGALSKRNVTAGQDQSGKRSRKGKRGAFNQVDPILSARASWAQSIRRKMPTAEIERRRLAYEAAKGKKP